MLIHWQSHQEYLYFLHETKVHLDSSQRTRLHLEFASAREKLRLLDLDPVMEYLSAFYSPGGRPADSDKNVFYFGHTLYMLCSHNTELSVDLPLHFRFLNARRHDSVSAIVSLREFRTLNPDIPIRSLCLDSAHDNYATYGLCKEWGICPFIDLNNNRGRPESIPDSITIDKDGTPLCRAGLRMVNWGYCKQKHSRKWRCPLACSKVGSCPCKENCSPSSYGRCVYTKPEWDIRLYPPVARGTDEYKKCYNNRTSCERVNNRVLNDYRLHSMGIHTSIEEYKYLTDSVRMIS